MVVVIMRMLVVVIVRNVVVKMNFDPLCHQNGDVGGGENDVYRC